MALKDNASLALIPAAYKTSKIYSAIPTDGDGDFTFTRSGNATRVNKAGLVETMGTNVGRLNYDLTNGTPASCPSLLLEPSRTNRVYPNNSISGYNIYNGTATNNQITAPDGSNTGALITKTSSNNVVIFKGFTGTNGVTHNISAFLKAGNHSSLKLQEGFAGAFVEIDLTGGIVGSTQNASNVVVEKHPNNWYRLSFNFTSASTNLQFSVYTQNTTATGKTFYLWGGQIEQGTFTTSIIPTTAGPVSRTEDNTYGAGDANLFSGDGTIFLDIEPFTHLGDPRITLSNSTVQNKIFFSFVNSTQVRMGVYEDPNLFAEKYQTISYNTRIKLAVTYKQNEFKFAFNGSIVHTDTLGEVPSGLNQLRFAAGGGSQKFQGKVFQTMVFNEALTNAELQTLTS